jgi:hypothetical protein
MVADPDWQAFAKKIQPLMASQNSRILAPAPWSPIGGAVR